MAQHEGESIEIAAAAAGEPVKLVIWDLDETFWRGTLSEGGIAPVDENIELVKALSARGIVNSICSKNDPALARDMLIQLGIWEHFIFPRIAFAPKGALIREIIEAAQLRTPSVLFIDDNPMNLNEALHYNEGLQVAGPEILPGLLAEPRCKGKPDPAHERLARYKVLEQKQADQQACSGDNIEFLRGSGIRVSFHEDVMEQFPRIHDLVNRTNQLNFTKHRWPEDEAAARKLAEEEYNGFFDSHWGYVKVSDRYGQYGICGFFHLRHRHALHFLFSCRAMNMGVEQFVWHRLGRPAVNVSGEVSSSLDSRPDWLTLVDDADAETDEETKAPAAAGPRPLICLRGACDLSMAAHYLRRSFDLTEEYQYPYEGWVIHRQAREIGLAGALKNPGLKELLDRIPGMPLQRYESAIHDGAADAYVLSFSPEFFGGHRRSRSTGAILPMNIPALRDKEFSSVSYEALKAGNPHLCVSEAQWAFLQEEFTSVPFLDETVLTEDLHCLFQKLAGKLVMLLQLNSAVGNEPWHLGTYKRINEIVLPVARHYGCHIIDMADFVRSTDDLVDPEDFGVHYKRHVYRRLAARVEEIARAHLPALSAPGRIAAGALDFDPGPEPAPVPAVPAPAPHRERCLISLGFRCDVAFQLRMHGRENVAHFFDWLATPIEGVIKIIDADFDVFYPDHLVLRTDVRVHCVEDRMTGTIFNHQFPLYAGNMQPDFLLHYQGFIGKFRHLAARFRQYMESRPVTLVRHVITREEALRLEQAVLRRFPGADVQFLYLVSPGTEFETPHGRARGLQYDESSLGNPARWAQALREEGLIGEPYRHGTVEILGAAHDDHDLSTDYRFSEAQLLAAIEANPRSAVFPLELARFYELNNMWAPCEEAAISALARDPRNQEALFKAALAQLRQYKLNPAAAAESFERLIAGTDMPPAAWLREAAEACFAAQRTEDALRHVNRAIRAEPLDQRLYTLKMTCLYHLWRWDEAELALAGALRFGPLPVQLLHIQAKLLARHGDFAAAAALECRLLDSAPGYVPSLVHLAELGERAGAVSEALRRFTLAMPFPPAHQTLLETTMAKLTEQAARSEPQAA